MQNSLCKHPNSFPAVQKIPRSEGYGRCLKSNAISDNYFKLYIVPNQLRRARLGIVVAKRYMPNSVDRNRTKREIRELFRIHQIKKCSIDLVVMVRKTENIDRSKIRDGLCKLFSRVAIRCTES